MKRLFFPFILLVLLVAACQPAVVPPTVAPPTAAPGSSTAAPGSSTAAATNTAIPTSLPPTAVPATATLAPASPTPAPTTVPPTAAAPTGTPVVPVDLTPAQLAAVNALADTLKVTADKITLVSTEAVNWPDGCLGIQLKGITCAKGPVPGFRIKLSAGGKAYEYHTNQDGTSVLSTAQGFQPLRVVVRQTDDSVQVVDTGFSAQDVSLNQGLQPMGGSVDGVAYVLDFKDQPKAQKVDATGAVTVLPFVDKPNYGLAVWPGNGIDQPRLAWATSPTSDPAVTQLFIATADGASVTPVLTETITAGQPPYQLLAERWSADGQSLYFSREPYGIGGYIPFAGASSLYRYNLADGSVTELIPFQSNGHWICLDDLTADASLAVGHCVYPKTISVDTLSSGTVQTITAPGTVTDFRLAGGARFSPDSTRVAFGLAKGDPSGEQGYLAVSDSLSGQSNFLGTTDPGHYYSVVAWLNDSTLLVQLNTLACNPVCTNSLWTIGSDGANLTKLTDGTFLTFVTGS